MSHTPNLRRLVLVRHGETAGESSVRYHGATDVPLSELGRRQMERVRAALQREAFDVAYTSALQRTVAAAKIVAPTVPSRAIPGFNEINFGAWEGLTLDEIAARDPVAFTRWRQSLDTFTYPDGDAVAAFRARVAATWGELSPRLPARVLLIAHRGVIACVLAEVLRLSPAARTSWGIDLASIHIVERAAGTWCAEVRNATDHLEGV